MRTTAGHVANNVKFACSYCGCPRWYPSEMVYTAERTFRCNWHENETTTNLEQAKLHGHGVSRAGDAPRFPVGTPAEWQS